LLLDPVDEINAFKNLLVELVATWLFPFVAVSGPFGKLENHCQTDLNPSNETICTLNNWIAWP
jgi:hypothetical protein